MTKFAATFENGTMVTRESKAEYQFAWGVWINGELVKSGFSKSRALAEKNAASRRDNITEYWFLSDFKAQNRQLPLVRVSRVVPCVTVARFY